MTIPLFISKDHKVSIDTAFVPVTDQLLETLHFLNFNLTLVQFSARESILVVTGTNEAKEFKDLMPDILRQVGPQQYGFLKDLIGQQAKGAKGAEAGEDDEDDVPPLVEGTFDSAGAEKEAPKEEPKEEPKVEEVPPEEPKEEPKPAPQQKGGKKKNKKGK